MKKILFTLNIGNYAPEITELTYPFLKKYAHRIEAEFCLITERKFPDWPLDYEKLQIYELGKGYEWCIYIDSDALVHPDFFDLTDHVKKDTVLHNGVDAAYSRWRYDKYFWRDGRNISSCNWFAMASEWCMDLWHPSEDLTPEQALSNIFPTHFERTCQGRVGLEEGHLVSDYTLSRNIARYGLKLTTTAELLKTLDPQGQYLWHAYTISREEKAANIKRLIYCPKPSGNETEEEKKNTGWGLLK